MISSQWFAVFILAQLCIVMGYQFPQDAHGEPCVLITEAVATSAAETLLSSTTALVDWRQVAPLDYIDVKDTIIANFANTIVTSRSLILLFIKLEEELTTGIAVPWPGGNQRTKASLVQIKNSKLAINSVKLGVVLFAQTLVARSEPINVVKGDTFLDRVYILAFDPHYTNPALASRRGHSQK
jgi:hypothetical protein